MSNTIANYIKDIADFYKNDSVNPDKPALTSKDFIAGLAFDIQCGSEFTMHTFDCHARYHKAPDQFIDAALGLPGTSKRACYEGYADELYRISQKYADCQDNVEFGHPYLAAVRKIEAQAKACR